MKKTKIKFEDIQAGDLLEVVGNLSGVKSVVTGIAFESDTAPDGEIIWMTSEGGAIVFQWDRDAIYRVEPDRTYGFDDIRKGDTVRLTKKNTGDITEFRIGVADHQFFYEDRKSYWMTPNYELLIHWLDQAEIEILERGE